MRRLRDSLKANQQASKSQAGQVRRVPEGKKFKKAERVGSKQKDCASMIQASTIDRLLRAQRAGRIVAWIDGDKILIASLFGEPLTDMTWRDALRRRLPYSESNALWLLDQLEVA